MVETVCIGFREFQNWISHKPHSGACNFSCFNIFLVIFECTHAFTEEKGLVLAPLMRQKYGWISRKDFLTELWVGASIMKGIREAIVVEKYDMTDAP